MSHLRAVLSLIVLGGLFWAGSAHAGSTGLTIQPVKISQTLEPGQSVSGTILLSNASEGGVLVEIKVEDFIPNAGGEGVKFVSRAEGLTTVRDWITLNEGEPELTMAHGEQQAIPYTITAPLDAEPGSHFGVAFFKAIDETQANAQLRVGTQVGTLIFVTIPGNHLQKGLIRDFNAPIFSQSTPITFSTVFENTGTVHFEPKGVITVKNIFGKPIAEVPVEGQLVLPTGVKELKTVFATNEFLLGRYTASIRLIDGEGQELSAKDLSFYVFPLWYALGFVAVTLVIFLLIRLIGSRFSFSISLKR